MNSFDHIDTAKALLEEADLTNLNGYTVEGKANLATIASAHIAMAEYLKDHEENPHPAEWNV